jgi:hypothetical protein
VHAPDFAQKAVSHRRRPFFATPPSMMRSFLALTLSKNADSRDVHERVKQLGHQKALELLGEPEPEANGNGSDQSTT